MSRMSWRRWAAGLIVALAACECGSRSTPELPSDMPENAAMRRERRARERAQQEPSEPPPPQIKSILEIDSGVPPTPPPKHDPRLVHRGFFDPVPASETSTAWKIPDHILNAPSGPSGAPHK